MENLRKWIRNARHQSLVQSLMPAVLAVIMALGCEGFNVLCAALAIVGVACFHLSMNLADDYFDYLDDMMDSRSKVIRRGFRAMTVKYPYLTDGSESPGSLRRVIVGFGAVAFVCGVVIFFLRTGANGFCGIDGSWWIVVIALLAVFLGVFYSAPPLKLAFRGLGELIIGVIFGPLLMMGVYYSCSGRMAWEIVWISIPTGLLVLNILYTHSLIDQAGDRECGKMTLALFLNSDKAALMAAYVFNLLPFAMIVVAVCLGFLHPLYLLVLVFAPRAIWLCGSLRDFSLGKQEVPPEPPIWLGKMPRWDAVRSAGVDWFLMRWMAARNTISGFCLATALAKIILMIV